MTLLLIAGFLAYVLLTSEERGLLCRVGWHAWTPVCRHGCCLVCADCGAAR